MILSTSHSVLHDKTNAIVKMHGHGAHAFVLTLLCAHVVDFPAYISLPLHLSSKLRANGVGINGRGQLLR